MNNMAILQQIKTTMRHCFIANGSHCYYIDFVSHTISKISLKFAYKYSADIIFSVKMPDDELLEIFSDYTEED